MLFRSTHTFTATFDSPVPPFDCEQALLASSKAQASDDVASVFAALVDTPPRHFKGTIGINTITIVIDDGFTISGPLVSVVIPAVEVSGVGIWKVGA